MSEKLLKIINHYGVMHQLKYFQSEVFELNEAIIRNEEADYNFYEREMVDTEYIKHVTEELADVEVMLLQFKEYYHIDGNEILKIMNEKIDRQLKRMEGEKNGK